MSLSLSLNLKNNVFENNVAAAIASMTKDTKDYIDENDYVNIMPRIGYYGDKKYPVYGTYNMSHMISNGNGACVTDAFGREVVYYNANDGVNALKWYRAYRFSDDTDYTYENEEIRPGYLSDDVFINNILGLSSEYIIYQTNNGQWHYVLTNGQEPIDWKLKLDITSIVTNVGMDVSNFIILKNGIVIGIYGRSGTGRLLKLYDTSTGNLISTVTLIPNNPFTKPQNAIGDWWSINNHFKGALIYNPISQQLVAYDNYDILYNNYDHYRSICQTWTISEDKLATGDFSGVTPKVQLPADADSIWGADKLTTWNTCATFYNTCYDSYTKQIFICVVGWDDYKIQIYKRNASSVVTQAWIDNQDIINHSTFVSPDACAWAKRLWPASIIMNNMIYLLAESKKYGYHNINIGYEHAYVTGTNYIKTIPGDWWITNEEENNVLYWDAIENLVCRKNGSEVKWYKCTDSDIFEVGFEDVTIDGIVRHGKRTLTPLNKSVPNIPNGYVVNRTVKWYYDPVRDIYITMVVKSVPVSDTWKYGQALMILIYNVKTGQYQEKEITNTTIYNDFINDGKLRQNNDMAGAFIFYSSMLIDDDGSCYVNIWISNVSDATDYTVKINTDYTVDITSLGSSPWLSAKGLGYDSVFGYYWINSDGFYDSRYIYHSRDFINGGQDYSCSDFINGKWYKSILTLKSATGLVAYSQKFPVLINGKCKFIESTEIPLAASCDNYIYIVGKDDKFTIEARQTKGLLSGENAFNTILVACITTNSSDPINTQYYDIDG